MINPVGSAHPSIQRFEHFQPVRTEKKKVVAAEPAPKETPPESKINRPAESTKSAPDPSSTSQEIRKQEQLTDLVKQAASVQKEQTPTPGNLTKIPTKTHVDLLA